MSGDSVGTMLDPLHLRGMFKPAKTPDSDVSASSVPAAQPVTEMADPGDVLKKKIAARRNAMLRVGTGAGQTNMTDSETLG